MQAPGRSDREGSPRRHPGTEEVVGEARTTAARDAAAASLAAARRQREEVRRRLRRRRRRPRRLTLLLLVGIAILITALFGGARLWAPARAPDPAVEPVERSSPRPVATPAGPAVPPVAGRADGGSGRKAPFTVTEADGIPSVELSAPMRRAIRRHWPGYRLRAAAALGTEALEELRQEHPDARSPYAIAGDFDGDGLPDVALLLRKGERGLLVALHGTPEGGFRGHTLLRTRWSDGLYLLRQPPGPLEYTRAVGEDVATTAILALSADAIRFHPVDAGARLYYWREGRYRAVEVGE